MLFNLEGKKVFVAGETGLVGRAVSRQLKLENCIALNAPHSALDLTDQIQTKKWFRDNKPDVVVMVAGRVGGILANDAAPADFISDNLSMALNVISASHETGVKKLLYLGSSCVYPRDCDQPIQEDALLTGPLESTNEAYAIAKIAGIKLCQSYRRQYGRDFITAMPANLYGPHDHFDDQNSHVIPALMLKIHDAKMNNKHSIDLMGSGGALREFLYVDDLAQAVCVLLKGFSSDDPVNIGSGAEISIHDLVCQISQLVGYKGDVIFDRQQGPDGTPRKILDSSTIKTLGWLAQTSLKEGLAQTYEWYLNNERRKAAA